MLWHPTISAKASAICPKWTDVICTHAAHWYHTSMEASTTTHCRKPCVTGVTHTEVQESPNEVTHYCHMQRE